jgi:proline iminopeptidase
MLPLYPSIRPYATHALPVDELHTLHLEESGKIEGIPVLVLHGGPGAGSHADQRRFFDPSQYRIILFDQRGCGQSTPQTELRNNTTPDLITDIERIREHLGIEKWVLFGGSWGAALALLYAQRYPDNVLHIIVRSIFLARQADLDWFFKTGARQVFPLQWQEFVKGIPRAERTEVLHAYDKLLNDENEIKRMSAAKAWSAWHRACATLKFSGSSNSGASHPANLRHARIEIHYLMNHCFLEPDQILNNMFGIRHISGTIVHGHYDMICPLSNAVELSELWSKAELEIIHSAGHASSEPALTDALIRVTNKYASREKRGG